MNKPEIESRVKKKRRGVPTHPRGIFEGPAGTVIRLKRKLVDGGAPTTGHLYLLMGE